MKENKEHKPKSQKQKNGICETEKTQKVGFVIFVKKTVKRI